MSVLTPLPTAITDQAHGVRRRTSPRPVKVITVTGGKGGVGKTGICANLAVSMSMLGRRVMLLDADLGLANVDVMFGLQPAHNLADVVSGKCELQDIVVNGPAGVMIVPGASGLSEMAQLTPAHHAGIINTFSGLSVDLDVLLVDTATGISDGVLRFAEAAHEVLIVVRDEPTSISDACAVIKVLSTERGVDRFRVVTNMTRQGGDGSDLFQQLLRVADRSLDVSLEHSGSVPFDDRVWRSVQLRTPFVTAFPSSLAAGAIRDLAHRADQWETPTAARGNIEFFFERLLQADGGARDSSAAREHGVAGDTRPAALVERHAPLVKRIAAHLLGRLPDNVELDDLIQVGLIALLDAARHYEAKKGASFETYASIRVRGAMLDEVRSNDWAPRSVYRKQRQIAAAIQAVENRTGKQAQARDIAAEMAVSLDEYFTMLATTAAARMFSLDQADGDTATQLERQIDGNANPVWDLESEEFHQAVTAAIGQLPERETLVMSLYYDEELNLKEIGQVLGVSESRVCQIHGQALNRLRARLQEWAAPGCRE